LRIWIRSSSEVAGGDVHEVLDDTATFVHDALDQFVDDGRITLEPHLQQRGAVDERAGGQSDLPLSSGGPENVRGCPEPPPIEPLNVESAKGLRLHGCATCFG